MTRFLKDLTYVKLLTILCVALCLVTLPSCGKDDPTYVKSADVSQVVLIYAVNNSSLSYDFISDRANMGAAMLNIDSSRRLLLYCIDNISSSATYKQPVLLEAVKNGSEIAWSPVKIYGSSTLSTDPNRIATVISDALSLYPNAEYDLFFWGHGTAWYPSGDSRFNATLKNKQVIRKSYGGEYTSDSGVKGWITIDELANAIPDSKFNTIWFDCCYMSNIESIYQFRNKCNTYVGYATEIWDDGLPYQYVLPYMLRENPDVKSAAISLFNYYNDGGSPVTVAACDMSSIEEVADAAKAILATGSERPSKSELTCYSRSTTFELYDFEQYMRLTAMCNAGTQVTSETYNLISAFNSALSDFVICHYESSTDFNHRLWGSDELSGISTHYFTDSAVASDDFYRSLDWYNRVYK
jgi:hypothetical protein